MSSLTEITEAVTAASAYHRNILLLHCISAYPAEIEDLNLRLVSRLERLFQLPVGYSSHDLRSLPIVAAVTLGACAVERHFTLSRSMRGSDHGISAEPAEFRSMVDDIRRLEHALGEERKVFAAEAPFREKLAKGIVAARDLPAGHALREEDFAFKSPARGLPPAMASRLVGRKLERPLAKDCYILVEDLDAP